MPNQPLHKLLAYWVGALALTAGVAACQDDELPRPGLPGDGFRMLDFELSFQPLTSQDVASRSSGTATFTHTFPYGTYKVIAIANHSPRFYAVMARYFPRWQEAHDESDQHAWDLNYSSFDFSPIPGGNLHCDGASSISNASAAFIRLIQE